MNNFSKRIISRVEEIEFLEILLSKFTLKINSYVKGKRVYVVIERKGYNITYVFTKTVFQELYFKFPAWVVTKYFSGEDIKYIIYNDSY